MNKTTIKDEFLSEEDLSIADMSEKELEAYWNSWLELAQSTNEEDENSYSHGVFVENSISKSKTLCHIRQSEK